MTVSEMVRRRAREAADPVRLLRVYDRAEKVAAAYRAGTKFALVSHYL